jgi:hypothetical protein
LALTSLKESLRYKAIYPARLAWDHARAIAKGNATKVSRILIASDNLAVTSDQQFAPLLANRDRISDELGILIDQQLVGDVLSSYRPGTIARSSQYIAVFAKLNFLTPDAEAVEKIKRLRAMFPSPTRLIYFDGDDDCCVQWGEVVEHVDLYVKKHIFSDLTWYTKQFAGKNNLTDYVTRNHGRSFADNPIPHSGSVSESQLHKIVLGYNIALDDKITHLYRTTQPSSPADKTVDVMCRAACKPEAWIYPFRGPIADALKPLEAQGFKVLVPNERVDQQGYYQEMRSSRISISPFGYGELCWRDFEAVLMGSLLVKPDMSHIRTEPDIFVANKTYVPVRWDFSDLAETCSRYLEDDQARNAITERAYKTLSDYYSKFGFLTSFRKLLAQAGVEPFTSERVATFAKAGS